MDNLITTSWSSSSSPLLNSAVYMEMDKTSTVLTNQVWSYGGISESRSRMQISSSPSPSTPLINCTTRKKLTENSSSSSKLMYSPLCGIILSLVILNSVIILHDFYSSFRSLLSVFKSFLFVLSCIWNCWAAAASARRPIEKCRTTKHHDQTETSSYKTDGDDRNLPLLELKKVIDGSLSNLQENLDELGGLFEEEEPSLVEVKEAFDVFDENKDGFIDAKELRKVLLSLGFMEASEEDCKRMIKGFDDNLDGRIDLGEFVKVMERSFC